MSGLLEKRKNILVISDLHLGEGLRAGTSPGGPGPGYDHLRVLERELSAFLIHYTAERNGGRPWRLIINGDMVDFMSILLFPRPRAKEGTPAPQEVVSSMMHGTDVWGEEEVFGLGTGELPSLLKLERVLDHHAGLFRLLASFVAAGNDLVIVLGNHDMEFCHEALQRAFIQRLTELGQDRRIARRVRFCPWFYYEKDLIYIEHGHQYDEYCSFDYQLCPAEASGGLALSFAHTGMRFFGNLVASYDQRTAEKWGLWDYFRWGWSLGVRTMLWLTYMYGLLAWKASEIGSLLSHPQHDAERKRRHRAQLGALSRTFRIQEEKLVALDALRVLPAVRRLAKILAALFLDRLLLGGLTVALMIVMLVLSPGVWKLLAAASVLLLAVGTNTLLVRFRGVTSPAALRRVTRAIHRIVRAPLIVFGHSHEPERVALPDGGVYFNTGTWMEGGSHHTGTHLVILTDPGDGDGSGPHAEMRKWRDGVAVKLDL